MLLNNKKLNIIFTTSRVNYEYNYNIIIDNELIEEEDSIKLLGLNVEKNLKWTTYMNKVGSKISSIYLH